MTFMVLESLARTLASKSKSARIPSCLYTQTCGTFGSGMTVALS